MLEESEMAWTSRVGKSIPVWGLSFRDLTACICLWQQRARSRRELLWLDERQLQDIGIDRQAAVEEAHKPFWR